MLVKPSFIEVWNVLNGYKVTEWPVAAPSSVALSADRMYVAYGERDAVMVRKLNSQQEPISCRADNLSGRVTSLVFSPDNTLIAFATGTAIRLFNSESGTLVRELHGHDAPVTTLAWASGDFLISGSEDGTMRFWRHLMRDDTLVPGYSRVGDVRRDGQQWFFVEKDAIRVFDQRSSEPVLIFAGHSREIMGAIYSPDGNRIASFANDGIVLVWDASSGIVLASFPHPGPIDAVAFSPDGQYLASSVANKSVYLWDLPRGHNTRILLKHEARITSMQFSPSSSELATASLDGTILIWNIRAEGEPLILRGHLAGVSTIAYEPSGATIASTSNDRTIRIWNASSGEELRRIAVTDQGVGRLQYSKLQYSSDGRRLMNGGVVLDTYLGERLYEIEGWGRALYYFSDGGRIITTVPDWTRTDLAMRIGELAVAPEPGAWVADRFDQLMDSDRVMRAIEQDTEHGEAFRSEAMVFARTRADNPQQLNADSWSVAKLRESSLAEYADALHKAERANALVPQNCRYLNTLGLALYRVGRYEDSLRTMEEAEALARGMSIANRAVKALALSRLGQVKTAREAYESMKYRMQDSQYSLWRGEVDREEWPLIEEARKEFGN
jgi:WD40 repeat protein